VLQPGGQQVIRLSSLSGAGYEWSVEIVQGDRESVAVEEIDADAPLGPPGESPEHVFRLSGLRPGETVLRFEQRRPWETDVPPYETKTFEIVVR
jgi:predicted secreted protein